MVIVFFQQACLFLYLLFSSKCSCLLENLSKIFTMCYLIILLVSTIPIFIAMFRKCLLPCTTHSTSYLENQLRVDQLLSKIKQMSDPERQLVLIEKAIKLLPNNYKVWRRKGKILFQQEKYHDALFCLEQSYCIQSKPTTLLWVAKVYHCIGFELQAETSLTEVIDLFEKKKQVNRGAFVLRAEIRLARKDFSGALVDSEMAIKTGLGRQSNTKEYGDGASASGKNVRCKNRFAECS